MSSWPVEYLIQLHRSDERKVGGLSLHQCSICFAVVVEDFMPDHEAWHKRNEISHIFGGPMIRG